MLKSSIEYFCHTFWIINNNPLLILYPFDCLPWFDSPIYETVKQLRLFLTLLHNPFFISSLCLPPHFHILVSCYPEVFLIFCTSVFPPLPPSIIPLRLRSNAFCVEPLILAFLPWFVFGNKPCYSSTINLHKGIVFFLHCLSS